MGIVEDAVPETETERMVGAPSQYVLEIGGGLAARLGIKPGRSRSISRTSPSRERPGAPHGDLESRAHGADAGDPGRSAARRSEPGLRAEVRRHPRARLGGADAAGRSRCPSPRGSGNDKTKQFPEVVEALARWGKRRKAAALLDGEIVALERRRRSDRVRAAAGADPPELGATRWRGSSASGRWPSWRSIFCATAATTWRSCRSPARRARLEAALGGWPRQHAADGAPGARRRHGADGGGAGARLGGDRRQGRALDLQGGAAHARLAEAEAGQAAGAGDRRLHRGEGGARALRRAAGRAADRGRQAPLRRARGRRLHREGAGARQAPAGRAQGRRRRRSTGRCRRPTASRTGSAPSWSPRCSSPSGRPRASCGSRSTSGCATIWSPASLNVEVKPPPAPAAPPTARGARRGRAREGRGGVRGARPARQRQARGPGRASSISATSASRSGPSSASPRASSSATTWPSRRISCRWCATGRWS